MTQHHAPVQTPLTAAGTRATGVGTGLCCASCAASWNGAVVNVARPLSVSVACAATVSLARTTSVNTGL